VSEWFKIRNGLPVTQVAFDVVEQSRSQIERNHGKTLEELSEHGGLDWYELWCGFVGRSLQPRAPISMSECREYVLDVVARLYRAPPAPYQGTRLSSEQQSQDEQDHKEDVKLAAFQPKRCRRAATH
jgi:hypothetical protein